MKQTLCDVCGAIEPFKIVRSIRLDVKGVPLDIGFTYSRSGGPPLDICDQCLARKLIEHAQKWIKPEKKPTTLTCQKSSACANDQHSLCMYSGCECECHKTPKPPLVQGPGFCAFCERSVGTPHKDDCEYLKLAQTWTCASGHKFTGTAFDNCCPICFPIKK